MTTGELFRWARAELGWDAPQMADRLGVTEKHLEAIESGLERAYVDQLQRVCQALRSSPHATEVVKLFLFETDVWAVPEGARPPESVW